MQKVSKMIFGLILFYFLFFVGCEDSKVNDPNDNEVNEVTVGVLISLTGNWSTLGVTSKAALESAAEEINNNFADEGTNMKLVLDIVDTKLDAEIAYTKTQELIADGVKIIIGPQSSAELAKIKPLLDENGVIAISMGSTAGSLAIPGDNILRFCPDDKPEGLGISKLMWERGIREVIAIYLNDDGNIGLKRSMTRSFTSIGGTVIDSISYTDENDITENFVNQISSVLSNASNQNEVGIYLAGFDEVTNIFSISILDSDLSARLWFGSNGSASSTVLISNLQASRFANTVEFCSPLFSLSDELADEWGPLAATIEQSTNLKPDAYAFAAYDALKVAALTLKEVSDTIDVSTLLNKYIEIANSFTGLTGLTELNEAGDRKYGNFTFMGICGTDPDYEWSSVGSYNAASDALDYTGCK